MALTLKSTIGEIMANTKAVEALDKINPAITGHPMLSAAMGMTVEQCAGFAPDILTKDVLEKIEAALATL